MPLGWNIDNPKDYAVDCIADQRIHPMLVKMCLNPDQRPPNLRNCQNWNKIAVDMKDKERKRLDDILIERWIEEQLNKKELANIPAIPQYLKQLIKNYAIAPSLKYN